MPEISRFFGMVIAMYYNDHDPPHFHAFYGEFEVTVRLNDGVPDGRFPRRALALVLEWYTSPQGGTPGQLGKGPVPEPLAPDRSAGVEQWFRSCRVSSMSVTTRSM